MQLRRSIISSISTLECMAVRATGQRYFRTITPGSSLDVKYWTIAFNGGYSAVVKRDDRD